MFGRLARQSRGDRICSGNCVLVVLVEAGRSVDAQEVRQRSAWAICVVAAAGGSVQLLWANRFVCANAHVFPALANTTGELLRGSEDVEL